MTDTTNDSQLWTEKYRPQTIDEIIGNDENLGEILKWFDDFHKRKPEVKRAVLLSGPPGLGKTTMAHCVLKHFNYRVKEYNASDIRSKKLVEANLHDIIEVGYIDRLYGADYLKFGIVMDEVDGMSTGDKGGMAELIKFINPNRGKRSVKKEDIAEANNRWIPPIICICNTIDKKIKDLKKDCMEIKFKKPRPIDLMALVDRICEQEGLNLEEEARRGLIDLSQADYRRLTIYLQSLYQMYRDYPNHYITLTEVEQSARIFTQKEYDLTLNSTVAHLLNDKVTCQNCLRMYESDKSLLPMMIHENYVSVIQGMPGDIFERLDLLLKVSRSIIQGDVIDKTMYNTQSWYLQPIHGLNSCYIPSFYLNYTGTDAIAKRGGGGGAGKEKGKQVGKTQKKKMQSEKRAFYYHRFTTALGKFSLHCSNQKNMNLINSMIHHKNSYNNHDIHHLSQVILHQLLDPKGDPEVGVRLLISYGLEIGDLEKLNKMDKLNRKRNYTSKLKTQLTKLYQKALAEYQSEHINLKYQKTPLSLDSPFKWPTPPSVPVSESSGTVSVSNENGDDAIGTEEDEEAHLPSTADFAESVGDSPPPSSASQSTPAPSENGSASGSSSIQTPKPKLLRKRPTKVI